MRVTRLLGFVAGVALAGSLLGPKPALAANVFYGEIVHVSTTNVKVYDPQNDQTLAFELIPQFRNIFNDRVQDTGRITYQMKDLHDGQYVAVVYDQKALGVRHADSIYIMNNANERLKKVPGG